ncbi:hypothetical protein LWI28_021222 [Acer negundo]|uniref:Uncharacterized protein n=1 Tax=Acer negundo TaxID=4023 RepID=A0AAD5P4M6_ACENE|nr:hypothetical protein LWI28_021222 [Acer negundo]
MKVPSHSTRNSHPDAEKEFCLPVDDCHWFIFQQIAATPSLTHTQTLHALSPTARRRSATFRRSSSISHLPSVVVDQLSSAGLRRSVITRSSSTKHIVGSHFSDLNHRRRHISQQIMGLGLTVGEIY